MSVRGYTRTLNVVAQADLGGPAGAQLPAQRHPGHQRPVAALQILEKEVPVAFEDLCVVPTDGLVVEHDVAAGMPAEDRPFAGEFEQAPGRAAVLGGEIGHV